MSAKHIGRRIHVYWADETAWFSGVVQAFDASQGYYVEYDDGDQRWEGLNESFRFEGQQASDDDDDDDDQDQEDQEGQEAIARNDGRGTTPRVMEPPASDDDDEEADDDGDHDPQQEREIGSHDDEEEDGHSDDHVPLDQDHGQKRSAYPQPTVLQESEGTASEAEDEDREDDDEDDARSVALTDVPTTYEPLRSLQQATHPGNRIANARSLPHRGLVRGIVVSASELPLVNNGTDQPCAFTRTAFVEGGSGGSGNGDTMGGRRANNNAMMMLRCKQALAETHVVIATQNPVWNDVGDGDDDHHHEAEETMATWQDGDGVFQLQVVPPLVTSNAGLQQPAWLQLRGDVVFSVYHQAHGDPESRSRNDFMGQASVTLTNIMREVFTKQAISPTTVVTLCLPLESRQGERVGTGDANLMVKFQFVPEFEPDSRHQRVPAKAPAQTVEELKQQPLTARSSRNSASSSPSVGPSIKSPSTSTAPPKTALAKRRPHSSSSEINRRKFEKQVDLENKAMAKRAAEQRRLTRARRAEQSGYGPAKSEPKLALTMPPNGGCGAVATAKKPHKASSEINRSKFVDQVKRENKAMGKRLLERAGRQINNSKSTAPENKHSERDLDWDDAKAQDKAHVLDKRHVLRGEKDYLLEKAQAKYHQQNELVEEVMALQTQVADFKSKLFTVKSTLQRVDAMNNKDAHVRDCLKSAVQKAPPQMLSSPVSGHPDLTEHQLLDVDDAASDSSATRKCKAELRELLQDAASLESEKQRLLEKLHALGSQEIALEDEIIDHHRKCQFVETKRAFQAKMATFNPMQAALFDKEIKAKKVSKELSLEEEDQYAICKAQEELTTLQISVTVLRDRLERGSTTSSTMKASSSGAACGYLRDKIDKRKLQIEQLQATESEWRSKYEAMVLDAPYDRLRGHVQELQHLLFLCQSEAKHVAMAERVAQHSKDKLTMELDKQRFNEQTETELVLKKKPPLK